jgi:hypothetical protein
LLTLFAASIAAGQRPPETPSGISEAYLAKDDGTGKAGEAAGEFTVTDIPIYAVVKLDSALPVTVKMNLVAASVPGVRPETKVVSTSYSTKDGEDRVNFSGRPAGKWTPGKYRADIFINGKLVRNLEFRIRPSAPTTAPASSFRSRTDTRPARRPVKN